MKLFQLIASMLFAVTISTNSIAAENVTKISGGAIKTELGYGIVLNKESSLTREWITVHDSTLPVSIEGTVGVKTIYESGKRYSSGNYRYSTEYTITTKEAVSAIEVRFLTFDIWGDHKRNLSATEIVDLEGGVSKKFDGQWKVYSENEVSEYYASIAYIAQVRTKNGRVIKANPSVVLEQARKFSKKFSEGDLEPKPEKK